MCHTKLSLDPLTDQQVWTAIEAAIASARTANQHGDDRTFDQLRADAVVDLLCRTGAGAGDVLARIPEVSVLIDLDTLLTARAANANANGRARAAADAGARTDAGAAARAGDGDGAGRTDASAAAAGVNAAGLSVCETADGNPLPVETVRRLCCEGDVLPIVLNGRSVPVDVGRSQRLATAAQRKALRAIYATCGHPECEVPFERCRIHHIRYWEHGGRSDLANMIPLCSKHHHLVHEGGWTLTLTTDRTTIWTAPDNNTLRGRPDRINHTASSEIQQTVDGGRASRNSDVRQIVDAVIRRRQRTTTSTAAAAAAAATRRRRDDDADAPVPLFADNDTINRRGPPAAS